MSTKNGGPAFPVPRIGSVCGMSLLDYYAGQALMGMIASSPVCDRTSPRVDKPGWARVAYEFADAMLAERERREGGT